MILSNDQQRVRTLGSWKHSRLAGLVPYARLIPHAKRLPASAHSTQGTRLSLSSVRLSCVPRVKEIRQVDGQRMGWIL